jgi:hypothetical protein
MAGLITTLKALGKHLEREVDNINCGGCCVVAAHVAYQMKYRLGIDAVIRTSHSWREYDLENVEEARNHIADPANASAKDWNEVGVAFGHVVVEFSHKNQLHHFDTNGVFPADRETQQGFLIHPGKMSVEDALAIASKPDGWNPMFNRKHIPAILNIITKYLKQVKPVRVG